VVKVVASGEVGGKPYFAAELVEGASLEELTFASPERRTLELAGFFREAARAVGALHEAGVLHRDLRPDRLVVTAVDRRVVVLEPDFAAVAGAGTALGLDVETRVASLRLVSPEQLAGSPLDLDARADIYALGATFHEVLTGRPFLEPADEEELEEQVALVSPPPAHVANPAVPRDLSAILQKCTAKERADRYPDIASLVRDLTAFLEGRPVAARPAPAFHRARLVVRRHRRWLAVVAGVGTLALATGLGLFLLRMAPHACAEGDLQDCTAQCKRGNSASCATLAAMFQHGDGAAKDPVRAEELYEKACDAASVAGCVGLGLMLSAEGRTPDEQARARDALQRACDQDDPRGCDALGTLFTEGRGGAADPAQAAALHDRACRAQYPVACGHLGALTEQGAGVPRDPSRARVLYMRACSEGAPAWCAVTAETLVLGRGGEKDEAQAARLFDRACAAGVLEGCAGLGKLLLRGGGVQQDEALGRALSKKACDGGLKSACEVVSP
jgi:TPR repeat protein